VSADPTHPVTREADEYRLRLELALKSEGLGMWDWDLVSRRVYIDDASAAIAALPRSSIESDPTTLNRALGSEDLLLLNEALERVREGKDDRLDVEVLLQPPTDTPRWIRVNGLVTERGANGLPTRMTGTLRDVSERRRTSQFMAHTQEIAHVGGFEFDITQSTYRWTEGTYRIYGVPDDFHPTADNIRSMIAQPFRAMVREAFTRARLEGRPFDIEYQIWRGDGRLAWARVIGLCDRFQGRPPRVYGIVQDISERKRLERELVEAANKEQQRLGRELHDGLGQELVGLSLMLAAVSQQVKSARPELARQMDQLTRIARSAVQSSRAIAHGLAPVSAQRGGLINALRMLVEELQGVQAIRLELGDEIDDLMTLDEITGNHLFRIAQEAVTNALRHGHPAEVTLRLASPAPGILWMEVSDDGIGRQEGAWGAEGVGLRSMRHRAAAIGGHFELLAPPGGGTRVIVTCPINGSAAQRP